MQGKEVEYGLVIEKVLFEIRYIGKVSLRGRHFSKDLNNEKKLSTC